MKYKVIAFDKVEAVNPYLGYDSAPAEGVDKTKDWEDNHSPETRIKSFVGNESTHISAGDDWFKYPIGTIIECVLCFEEEPIRKNYYKDMDFTTLRRYDEDLKLFESGALKPKTYKVKITNGAGTILTSAVAEFVDDYLTDEPLQTHIAPEDIEGQERYEVDRGEPKGSTVPPTYAWRIKDGLYEMEKVEAETYYARDGSVLSETKAMYCIIKLLDK